jgi:hypothetical protein
MDIKRKLEVVQQAVDSIANHTDADSTVLLAALDHVKVIAEDKAAQVRKRVQQETLEALTGPKA